MSIRPSFERTSPQTMANQFFFYNRLLALGQQYPEVVMALMNPKDRPFFISIENIYYEDGIKEFCEETQKLLAPLTDNLPRANIPTAGQPLHPASFSYGIVASIEQGAFNSLLTRAIDLAFGDGLNHEETNWNLKGRKIARQFIQECAKKFEAGTSLEEIIQPFMPANQDLVVGSDLVSNLIKEASGRSPQ